jgi:hypothetical protein
MPFMPDSERPIILCPLEFERQRLQAAGLEEVGDLICTGPGAESIVVWALNHQVGERKIVLVGLAGALSPEFAAGNAYGITDIVDENGEDEWTPPLVLDDADQQDKVVATSTHAPLTGRLARKIMSQETGGMLIDLESVAFASSATKHGWTRWGIIRGISDDFTTLLPKGLEEWIDESGQTRWGAVMRSLLLKPMLIPKVVELRQHSTSAMNEAASKLKALLLDESD